jgi:hypothetical protein
VIIRNGRVTGESPIRTIGHNTLIEGMTIVGRGGGVLLGGEEYVGGDAYPLGGGNTLRHSAVSCGDCMAVSVLAPSTTVTENSIAGGGGAIYLSGLYDLNNDGSDSVRVIGNNILCGYGNAHCVTIGGIGNIFARNTLYNGGAFQHFQPPFGDPPPPIILIAGLHHQITDNDVMMFGIGQLTLMKVDGAANIIRGTTVSRASLWQTGILFSLDGNSYGDNYVGGSIEGAAGQIDLGGNVSD